MSLGDHLRELRRRVPHLGRRGPRRRRSSAGSSTRRSTRLSRHRSTTTRRPTRTASSASTSATRRRRSPSRSASRSSSGCSSSSPVWMYQIWAFIVPGLTRKERRISLAFIAAIVPLFLAGCALAYYVLPKVLAVLYGFTPPGASNIQQVSRLLLVRHPLHPRLRRLVPPAGLARGAQRHRPPARRRRCCERGGPRSSASSSLSAIATPTPDAFTMFLLAIPLVALYFAAIGVSKLIERGRARTARLGRRVRRRGVEPVTSARASNASGWSSTPPRARTAACAWASRWPTGCAPPATRSSTCPTSRMPRRATARSAPSPRGSTSSPWSVATGWSTSASTWSPRPTVPLAIIGAGTGNDVARGLGLPVHDPVRAADLVTTGVPRVIDAVRHTDAHGERRWYAGVLGAGFDSVVNERANTWPWPQGPDALQPRRSCASCRCSGRSRTSSRSTASRHETQGDARGRGATARRYGGGMRVAPDAGSTTGSPTW